MALNLLNLKKAGARISNGGRVVEFDLMGSDGVLHLHGFALPEARSESDEFSADTAHSTDPTARDFRDDDASTLAATRALFAFSQFSKALATVAGDRLLSRDGKMAGVRTAGTKTLQALGTHFARLQQISPSLTAQGAQLLAVPRADPAEAAWDVEVYRHWNSLERDRRVLFELGLQEPDAERAVLALKRTPGMLLGPAAQKSVASAWEGHIARKQPEKWATYQAAQANFDWAADFVPYLAKALRDTGAPGGAADAVPRMEAYKILRPLAATPLLRFEPHEVRQFEALIAAEPARQSAAA